MLKKNGVATVRTAAIHPTSPQPYAGGVIPASVASSPNDTTMRVLTIVHLRRCVVDSRAAP